MSSDSNGVSLSLGTTQLASILKDVFAPWVQDLNLAIEGVAEHGSLSDRQPHIEANQYEDAACEKRNAPAVGEELFVRQPAGEQQEYAAGEEESDRCAQLRKHAVPSALPGRRILDGEEHGTAPLAAEAEALAEAAQRQEKRRDYAYGAVSRQSADAYRGESHCQ